jgi:hypothetical protein
MRRRNFLTFLGCAAAWVSTARGEEPSHVVGFLSAFFAPGMPGALAAFYQGLKETGFFEGKNISVEFRWADGRYDRLPSLAAGQMTSHPHLLQRQRPKRFPLFLGPVPIRSRWVLSKV